MLGLTVGDWVFGDPLVGSVSSQGCMSTVCRI